MRPLWVRFAAVAVLAALTALTLSELDELRGELAFARFRRLMMLAEKSRPSTDIAEVLRYASVESRLVRRYGRGNPDALGGITVSALRWSRDRELGLTLRLHLAEEAVQAALLAVRSAPSDYEPWVCLAQSFAAVGLGDYSRLCLKRAQELAPPGMKLQVSSAFGEKTS